MRSVRADIEYAIRCTLCGQVYVERHAIEADALPPLPACPPGWHVVDGLVICKDHAVSLLVDGHRTIEL